MQQTTHRTRVGLSPLLPAQGREAVKGQLHILVPIHLEDVAALLVDGQAPLHVPPVKLEAVEYLHIQHGLAHCMQEIGNGIHFFDCHDGAFHFRQMDFPQR